MIGDTKNIIPSVPSPDDGAQGQGLTFPLLMTAMGYSASRCSDSKCDDFTVHNDLQILPLTRVKDYRKSLLSLESKPYLMNVKH